jgi:superfamily II DNA or RNA helicase
VGAGKTHFGSACIRDDFDNGIAKKAIIVVPSKQIRDDWIEKATEYGIHLSGKWDTENDVDLDGYDGAVICYQQITKKVALVMREYCKRHRVSLIFDECHHLQATNVWAKGCCILTVEAARELYLTATLWRTDQTRLYGIVVKNGYPVADGEYQYRDALFDHLCRAVTFPMYNGDIKVEIGGHPYDFNFDKEVDEKHANVRLRAAIDPEKDFARNMLVKANDCLDNCRKNVPDVGGIVFAEDVNQAKEYCDFLRNDLGQDPLLVIGEDSKAQNKINAFKGTKQKWIVCIDMIREGASINRLMVGVYLKVETAAQTVIQAIGRVVRRRGPDDYMSHFFMPADPRLDKIARTFREDHTYWSDAEENDPDGDGDGNKEKSPPVNIEVISTDSDLQHAWHNGSLHSKQDMEFAEAYIQSRDMPVTAAEWCETVRKYFPEERATYMKVCEELLKARQSQPQPSPVVMSKYKQVKILKSELNKAIKVYATYRVGRGKKAELGVEAYLEQCGQMSMIINANIKSAFGKPRSKCNDLDELKRMKEWIVKRTVYLKRKAEREE